MLKLGLGKTQSMMATFSHYQLIQLNYAPLVLTLIADMDANPGLLLSIGRDMEPLLQDIQRALRLL